VPGEREDAGPDECEGASEDPAEQIAGRDGARSDRDEERAHDQQPSAGHDGDHGHRKADGNGDRNRVGGHGAGQRAVRADADRRRGRQADHVGDDHAGVHGVAA
jgi:hypothetical protein